MLNASLLKELPVVEDRNGWPWNMEVDSSVYDAEVEWPKISIVTPSYNQGQYIEETIRSILLQNYPNLEYIIIDGGSTDHTTEIIEKYSPWITWWVSEKDKGQADAINKGVEKCTGEIFNWINSDDLLTPQCLPVVGRLYQKGSTVAGRVHNFFETNSSLNFDIQNQGLDFATFTTMQGQFHQPGVWCSLIAFKKAGKLPVQYTYYFDRIFLTRYFFDSRQVVYTDAVLVFFRMHETSKTNTLLKAKNVELIDFYQKLLKDSMYQSYYPQIKKTLTKYLIAAEYINRWETKYENRGYLSRVCTYLLMGVRRPQILLSYFYLIRFKQKFITTKN